MLMMMKMVIMILMQSCSTNSLTPLVKSLASDLLYVPNPSFLPRLSNSLSSDLESGIVCQISFDNVNPSVLSNETLNYPFPIRFQLLATRDPREARRPSENQHPLIQDKER